jgi:hypothetical protein
MSVCGPMIKMVLVFGMAGSVPASQLKDPHQDSVIIILYLFFSFQGSAYHSHNLIKREGKELEGNDYSNVLQHQQQHQSSSGINMPPAWQSIATPGSTGE